MKTRHGHERSEETTETRDGKTEEEVTENAEARIQPMENEEAKDAAKGSRPKDIGKDEPWDTLLELVGRIGERKKGISELASPRRLWRKGGRKDGAWDCLV